MRRLNGWLWQFTVFRYLVLRYVHAGAPGAAWLSVNTPLLFSLREFFRDLGDLRQVAELDRMIQVEVII